MEEERLNAPDVTPPSVPFDLSTRNMVEIEISSIETFEQPSVVEVDEVTTAHDPSIVPEVPVTEPSSSVAAVQPLINLEEGPIATDAEEEPRPLLTLLPFKFPGLQF